MLNTQTLRPGLLVSLKTNLMGNVVYRTLDLVRDYTTEEGQRMAKWETERTIQDPEEHERGVKARSKARSLITAICAPSSFGLLCPESQRDKLNDAIEEARAVADAFNSTSSLTKIAVFVIVGRVASDDAEAVRAIGSEVRDLLSQMENGVRTMNAAVIREAANKARALGSMLSDDAAQRVKDAIESVRKTAREIVKTADVAALEVDAVSLRAIEQARTAFLEIEPGAEVQAPTEDSGRAVDFEPSSPALQDLYGTGQPVREVDCAPGFNVALVETARNGIELAND